MPAFESAITEARANIDAIKNDKTDANFENTIEKLETASEQLSSVSSVYYNQLSAVGGDDLHALTETIGPMTASFSSDVNLDADLFARVKKVYDQKDDLDLTPEQDMLLTDTYKGFVRSGALLNENEKGRLREISQQLSTLSPAFMQNVSKSAESFELHITDKNDLAGLPDSAIDAAKLAAQERDKDGWVFTLDYPSFGPFLQFADNRELREQVWRAFSNRAYNDEFDNCENILKIVNLKNERAKLLGHENHAEFVLEERMAKSADNVMEFLNKLKSAYKPEAEKELQTLKDFAKDLDGIDDLKPWDSGYYSEKMRQKLFNISSEDFRPYLQLDNVLNGCFKHFEKLFGIRFKENATYPVWHKDVKAFDVYNTNDDSFVGTLYGDFHPRTGKNPAPGKPATVIKAYMTARLNALSSPLFVTSPNQQPTVHRYYPMARSQRYSTKWATRFTACYPM